MIVFALDLLIVVILLGDSEIRLVCRLFRRFICPIRRGREC